MSVNLNELKNTEIKKLHALAAEMNLDNTSNMKRQDLVFNVVKRLAQKGSPLHGEGSLEIMQDGGYGFLRSSASSYLSGADDIYVAPNQIRKNNLRTGDTVRGTVRPPEKGERYFALVQIETINDQPPEKNKNKILYRDLTAEFPNEWLRLQRGNGTTEDISSRVIDLTAPIGKGQRSLIVAPPKTGKTMLLQSIAHSITANNPECKLIVLMIDERPEEVTEMRRSVRGEVVASTCVERAHGTRMPRIAFQKIREY